MPHPNGMPKLIELRSMSDEELFNKIDSQFALTPDVRHLLLAQLFRDELFRREQERNSQVMLRFTKQIRDMTIIILVATILSVVASGVSIWNSLNEPSTINKAQLHSSIK